MLKALLYLVLTVGIIYLLNTSWDINGTRIPPLGKFLDPMQGFWQNAEPENAIGPEALQLAGLESVVNVRYDSLLIPHVFAANDEDVYQAQGYITATHRLWQMEFQTHASAGRLASILGVGPDSSILNYDRNQRRLGIPFAAQRTLDAIHQDPVSKRMVEKYTEGVNQYINSLTYKNLPLEYKLMDYRPEPWTPLKCALLLKSMCQTLNMGDKDMQMTNAFELFGKDMMDLLYPDHELDEDPIVSKPNGWNFKPILLDTIPPAIPDDVIKVSEKTLPDPTIGSNNWAVSGAKTKSGSPILCNDPHLNTSLPSLWFAIQLHSPTVNTMGVSFPGAPCVIIGFNDSIAWGVTNAQRDLIDWYKITYEDPSRSAYWLDGKWVPTEKKVEAIQVRDHETIYDTVVYTHWGPVTYDRNFRAHDNKKDYAFRWISHDPSNEVLAFYKLNRSKNYSDFVHALNYYAAPAQNFIFASTTGTIALHIQGKFPVRRKDEGKYVLDGSKSTNGWQAFIPNEQNIHVKNPARGFVSSANQYPADSTYPYYITATHYEAYRNRRINQVLRDNDAITVQDMMNLQNDNFNLRAQESLPMLLHALDTSAFAQQENYAYHQLKAWDYYNAIASEGATFYDAWLNNVMAITWDEMDNLSQTLSRPTFYTTIKLIAEKPALPFFDIQQTQQKENAFDVVNKAFHMAVEDVEVWKRNNPSKPINWGNYKDTYVQHLARLAPFSEHVQHGGGVSVVNASSHTHGPSWRMIVSLDSTGVNAWATYPGGQSGNPGSTHYADLLKAWAAGKYYHLQFLKTPDVVPEKLFYSTTLNPAK